MAPLLQNDESIRLKNETMTLCLCWCFDTYSLLVRHLGIREGKERESTGKRKEKEGWVERGSDEEQNKVQWSK